MGLHTPKSYKVKRNGEWIVIQPPAQPYVSDKLKPIDVKKPKRKR